MQQALVGDETRLSAVAWRPRMRAKVTNTIAQFWTMSATWQKGSMRRKDRVP